MKIHNVKQINKGSVSCTFDIEFEEWGITIRSCILITGQKGKFVSFPSRTYDDNGQKKYFPYVVMTKELKKRFDEQVISRLKNHVEPTSVFAPEPNTPEPETDLF